MSFSSSNAVLSCSAMELASIMANNTAADGELSSESGMSFSLIAKYSEKLSPQPALIFHCTELATASSMPPSSTSSSQNQQEDDFSPPVPLEIANNTVEAPSMDAEIFFNVVPEDILVNIFCRADEDPRDLARISCVCTRFAAVIRTVCWKFRCMRTLPPVLVADLLQNPNAHAEQQLGEPPGGWASLQKLLVCCPGLWHAGVLLETWDFGLDREFGWSEASQSGFVNSAHNKPAIPSVAEMINCSKAHELASVESYGQCEAHEGSEYQQNVTECGISVRSDLKSNNIQGNFGKPSHDGCTSCDTVLGSSELGLEGCNLLKVEALKHVYAEQEKSCNKESGIHQIEKSTYWMPVADNDCVKRHVLSERKRPRDWMESKRSSHSSLAPENAIEKEKKRLQPFKPSKQQRKYWHELSHVASGTWNLSREQGNKLLANRFRADSLYICDWPGCLHPGEKRKYKLFRGVFKTFKNSHVWRNLKDMKAKATYVGCAFCACKSTWDMVTTFCLKRSIEYHDDGEPVVRAYVCENGHVAGAWTDRPIYSL